MKKNQMYLKLKKMCCTVLWPVHYVYIPLIVLLHSDWHVIIINYRSTNVLENCKTLTTNCSSLFIFLLCWKSNICLMSTMNDDHQSVLKFTFHTYPPVSIEQRTILLHWFVYTHQKSLSLLLTYKTELS